MKNDKEKRLIRLLKIILTLDQGSVRVENLANEEGCSTRTIQRDIAALQAAGLPLIKKYNGSFAFVEDFNLRNITKTNAVDYSFLNENAAKEEFKYLYNTSAKYSLITRNG